MTVMTSLNSEKRKSGVYDIFPRPSGPKLPVYCDMTTDGGGWTVFQRRLDGSEDFFRRWESYKNGFGKINREMWLGNENLHKLTTQKKYDLRIEMTDFGDRKYHAVYHGFLVDGENDGYRLRIGAYNSNSTTGDSLSDHNKGKFSTTDRDNDGEPRLSCSDKRHGGWWFSNHCGSCNLNGKYHQGGRYRYGEDGITWYTMYGFQYSMKTTEMKFRPSLT